MPGLFHPDGFFPLGFNPILKEKPPTAVRVSLDNLDNLFWLTNYVWASRCSLRVNIYGSSSGADGRSLSAQINSEVEKEYVGKRLESETDNGEDIVLSAATEDLFLVQGTSTSPYHINRNLRNKNNASSYPHAPGGFRYSLVSGDPGNGTGEFAEEDSGEGYAASLAVLKYRYGASMDKRQSGNIGLHENEFWYSAANLYRSNPADPWSVSSVPQFEIGGLDISAGKTFDELPPDSFGIGVSFGFAPFEDDAGVSYDPASWIDDDPSTPDIDEYSPYDFTWTAFKRVALNSGAPVGYIDPSRASGRFRKFPKIPIFGVMSVSDSRPSGASSVDISGSAALSFDLDADYRSWGGIYDPTTGARL